MHGASGDAPTRDADAKGRMLPRTRPEAGRSRTQIACATEPIDRSPVVNIRLVGSHSAACREIEVVSRPALVGNRLGSAYEVAIRIGLVIGALQAAEVRRRQAAPN